MKKILSLMIVFICAVSLCSCEFIGEWFSGIGNSGTDDTVNNNGTNGAVDTDNKDNQSAILGYRIVYSASADSETVNIAKRLQKLLKDLTGLDLELVNDEADEIEKEFLIGATNRRDSVKYANFLPKDFAVVRSGEKIVIIGGSSDSLTNALNYLKKNYFNQEDKKIELEDNDGHIYRHPYASVLVGNTDISSYSILVDEKTASYAEELNDLLYDKIGEKLQVISDINDAEYGKIIDISIDYNKYPSKYYITIKDSLITIGAPTEKGMEKAFVAFIDFTGLNDLEDSTHIISVGGEHSAYYSPSIFTATNAQKIYLKGEAVGGSLSYKLGEDVLFYITLNADDQLVGTNQIKCEITGDNTESVTEYYPINSGEAFVSVPSLDQPGVVQIKVTALDAYGEPISGVSSIKIGAFLDAEKITTAVEKPSDFKDFWQSMIDKLYEVDPTDTSAPKENEDSTNYFHIEKITKDFIPYYIEQTSWQSYGRNFKAEYLDVLDVYEFTLKCYGEMPATGFISIPKDVAEGKTYPIRITTCGYGIYRAFMPYDTDAIIISMNTHGLSNMGPHSEYEFLKTTRIENGGLVGYGTLKSDYDDPSSAYYTYVLLRNMQALRYAMDAYAEYWDGTIIAKGASQGGLQSIAIAALATLTSKWDKPIVVNTVNADVPWMCDIGGDILGRDVCSIVTYCEGIEYFDSANFATLITESEVTISGGYADETVPPTGVICIYNNLQCPKKLIFTQNKDHGSAHAENRVDDVITDNMPQE